MRAGGSITCVIESPALALVLRVVRGNEGGDGRESLIPDPNWSVGRDQSGNRAER